MRFDVKAKVEKACATDKGRYCMDRVRFTLADPVTGGPALVATNGRFLAVVPVEAEPHDSEGYLTVDALKAARKLAAPARSKLYGRARIVANGAQACYAVPSTADAETGAPDTSAPALTMPRPGEEVGEFPRYSAVVPTGERKLRVTFNAAFLADLAEAIGSAECVTLEFASAPDGTIERAHPIRVHGTAHPSERRAVGVLMPITRDD